MGGNDTAVTMGKKRPVYILAHPAKSEALVFDLAMMGAQKAMNRLIFLFLVK
jgi:hypothetical protein